MKPFALLIVLALALCGCAKPDKHVPATDLPGEDLPCPRPDGQPCQ